MNLRSISATMPTVTRMGPAASLVETAGSRTVSAVPSRPRSLRHVERSGQARVLRPRLVYDKGSYQMYGRLRVQGCKLWRGHFFTASSALIALGGLATTCAVDLSGRAIASLISCTSWTGMPGMPGWLVNVRNGARAPAGEGRGLARACAPKASYDWTMGSQAARCSNGRLGADCAHRSGVTPRSQSGATRLRAIPNSARRAPLQTESIAANSGDGAGQSVRQACNEAHDARRILASSESSL